MANYRVAFASSAEKERKKLSGQLIARLVPHLEDLGANPRPSLCKKLRVVMASGAFASVTTGWCTPLTTPDFWW